MQFQRSATSQVTKSVEQEYVHTIRQQTPATTYVLYNQKGRLFVHAILHLLQMHPIRSPTRPVGYLVFLFLYTLFT